jgi:Leucine-rich repeat (LRR) protein
LLKKLPNLKELYLQGNPIVNLPKEVYDFEKIISEVVTIFCFKYDFDELNNEYY